MVSRLIRKYCTDAEVGEIARRRAAEADQVDRLLARLFHAEAEIAYWRDKCESRKLRDR